MAYDKPYNKFPPKETTLGKKDLIILLQNSMAHATNIAIHNAKGEAVEAEAVVEMAKAIAREVFKTANSLQS
jgi:hypothetical protein